MVIFAGAPVDAADDPQLAVPAEPPAGEAWLLERPDVRLFSAQVAAAERVADDVWKSWLPSATAVFAPRYVTPAGFFEPADTWRAAIEVRVPLYDSTLRAKKRLRVAERNIFQLRLDAVKDRARSDLRLAREAVDAAERVVEASRQAAENAADALRITEIAYRAGRPPTSRSSRPSRRRGTRSSSSPWPRTGGAQARLQLLVALGQFP